MLRRLFGSRARSSYDKGIERFNAGDPKAAIEHFDDALRDEEARRGPDGTLARFYRAQAHARLGAAALESVEARRALEHFDAAIADHPSYPDLHLQRGLALLLLDDPLAAESAAREALRINEKLVDAGALLVVALGAQGHRQRAEQERRRWSSAAGSMGHPLHALLEDPSLGCDALLEHRRAQLARRRRIERVDGLLHQGFWKDARRDLEAILESSPAYPDLRLRMAAALAGLGEEDQAAQHLDLALETNPDFVDAHVLSGIVAVRRDRVAAAKQHFTRAHELGNVSSPVQYGLALCELRAGDWHSARRRLDSIWEGEEFATEVRFLRAVLLWLDGDRVLALRLLHDAVHGTESADLLLDAAAVGLREQDYALVRRAVDALPPGAPEAASALVRAALLQAEGNRDRAVDVLESATADHPDDPAVLWALAQAHAQRGEVEVALRRLSNLQALGARVPGATALALRLHRERGDLERALGVLDGEGAKAESDPELALQELYVLRANGESDRARAQWQRWSKVLPLDPRWRVQGPRRWLAALAPWPANPAAPGR